MLLARADVNDDIIFWQRNFIYQNFRCSPVVFVVLLPAIDDGEFLGSFPDRLGVRRGAALDPSGFLQAPRFGQLLFRLGSGVDRGRRFRRLDCLALGL